MWLSKTPTQWYKHYCIKNFQQPEPYNFSIEFVIYSKDIECPVEQIKNNIWQTMHDECYFDTQYCIIYGLFSYKNFKKSKKLLYI